LLFIIKTDPGEAALTKGIKMSISNESLVPENAEGSNQISIQAESKLLISNKIIRLITLGLQIVSMLAFYMPTIIFGGEVGVIWLLVGVAQTFLFSKVFFRDERTYKKRSIILMIAGTIFNIAMLLFIEFHAVLGDEVGMSFVFAYIYAFCSLAALVSALIFPRKYK